MTNDVEYLFIYLWPFVFLLRRFVYLSEREKEGNCMSKGKGRWKESQADSLLSAKADMGLDLTNLRSWSELTSAARHKQMKHVGAPVSFGEKSIQIFCPGFNWVISLLLSSESSLYILDTKSLSNTFFKIFSPICCLPLS